jgi:hypothetical protein
LNVDIKSSKSKHKKIDVYKNNKKVASIGDVKYNDYPTYLSLEKKGLIKQGYANERRKLYRIRHKKNIDNKDGNGYYSNKILW